MAIRPGAFDDLPNVNNCKNIFTNCSSLAGIPASLFSRMKIEDFQTHSEGVHRLLRFHRGYLQTSLMRSTSHRYLQAAPA
jgi:hypothetical protein